jgi:RNA polymerase sigma factor (sigma-70 family)
VRAKKRTKGVPSLLNSAIQSISQLLAGDSRCQEEAIRLTDKHLRLAIIAKIRRTAPSLPFEEVVDAYQEVLLGIWRAAAMARFSPRKPLLPFVLTIAQRKAVDHLRKRTSADYDYDVLFDTVSARLTDSSVAEAWEAAVAQEDGQRMMILIRDAVSGLPEQQRRVAAAVIDRFPDVPPYEELSKDITSKSGQVMSVAAVKRAWQEARKKIRDLLIREGYMEDRTNG